MCFPSQVVADHVYTASYDGNVQVFQLPPGESKLRTMYRSESKRHRFGGGIVERPILSMNVFRSTLYFGDDGVNVKAVNWKDGVLMTS